MSATHRRAIKDLLRPLLPDTLLRRYRTWVANRQAAGLEGQDLRSTFSELYRRNLWGGAEGEFYSGRGSDDAFTRQYVAAVRTLISDAHVASVVDLGCGDFRVGRQLQRPGLRYVGVDIVPDLVQRNQREFGGPECTFQCLDITDDPLPPADLCLVRQVLQHLSNAQIARALQNCRGYPRLVVTEHVPAPARLREPNLDHPHGPSTRLVLGSGVYVDRPPFSLRVARTLCEVALPDDGSVLRTVLVEQHAS